MSRANASSVDSFRSLRGWGRRWLLFQADTVTFHVYFQICLPKDECEYIPNEWIFSFKKVKRENLPRNCRICVEYKWIRCENNIAILAYNITEEHASYKLLNFQSRPSVKGTAKFFWHDISPTRQFSDQQFWQNSDKTPTHLCSRCIARWWGSIILISERAELYRDSYTEARFRENCQRCPTKEVAWPPNSLRKYCHRL